MLTSTQYTDLAQVVTPDTRGLILNSSDSRAVFLCIVCVVMFRIFGCYTPEKGENALLLSSAQLPGFHTET